jgi:hypothetical protein
MAVFLYLVALLSEEVKNDAHQRGLAPNTLFYWYLPRAPAQLTEVDP